MADYVGSTSGIINHATVAEEREFIVCTEKQIHKFIIKKEQNVLFVLKYSYYC